MEGDQAEEAAAPPFDNNSIFNAHLLKAGHKSAILFMVLQV